MMLSSNVRYEEFIATTPLFLFFVIEFLVKKVFEDLTNTPSLFWVILLSRIQAPPPEIYIIPGLGDPWIIFFEIMVFPELSPPKQMLDFIFFKNLLENI